MMLPILISSVVALAIVVERFWTLRPSKLSPPDTLNQVRGWLRKGSSTPSVSTLCASSRRWGAFSPPAWPMPATAAKS